MLPDPLELLSHIEPKDTAGPSLLSNVQNTALEAMNQAVRICVAVGFQRQRKKRLEALEIELHDLRDSIETSNVHLIKTFDQLIKVYGEEANKLLPPHAIDYCRKYRNSAY